MLSRGSWFRLTMRFAVWAVIASVALMPGTVRASVVHVHDHGLHEHQQPLFLSTPAGAGHSHHHNGHEDGPGSQDDPGGEGGGDVSVVESGIVDEAVTAQSATSLSLFIAMPVVLVAMVARCDALGLAPPSQQPALDASSSCVCRIVQTSHALLL